MGVEREHRVSTRLTSDLIAAAHRHGLAVDAKLRERSLPVPQLEDRRGRLPWEVVAECLEVLELLGGGPPHGLADLVRDPESSGPRGALGRLFRFAVRPRQLYAMVVRFAGPADFPTHDASFEVLPDRRFRIEIRIDPEEPGSEPFFRACSAFYEIAPRLLDLPEALVESEIEPHRGVFFVTPPPGTSLWSRLKRVTELFRSSQTAVDELRAQHDSLAQRGRELEQARLELLESEQRFADAFQASPTPMIVAPLAGDRLLEVNESFVEALGLSREEIFATDIPDLPLWPPGTDVAGLRRGLRERPSVRSMPLVYRNALGEERRGLLSSSLSRVSGQDVLLVQVVDVTENEELHERLRQSQKLEVVGQLAGGVAHDFNNLLTVIGANADQLLLGSPAGSAEHEAANEILQATDSASKLTGQLLAFGRRQVVRPQHVDLSSTVRGMLGMLRRLISESIAIADELAEDLAPVVADPGQLEQVLLNLAVNARDAMPDGGDLRIVTRAASSEEVRDKTGDATHDAYVALDVEDTGSGIDPEVVTRIFEPFFTTKPPGAGTGLGLSTVQRIVREVGGGLHVDSAPDAGSRFRVYFPAASDRLDAPGTTSRGNGHDEDEELTVLLAEDEAPVRRVLCRSLESAGYHVLAAGDGIEALDLERRHPGPIHVLVSDVVMPEMSGPELMHELTNRRPGVRTLLMSGYPLDRPVDDSMTLLPKPFRPEELVTAIRSALADRA